MCLCTIFYHFYSVLYISRKYECLYFFLKYFKASSAFVLSEKIANTDGIHGLVSEVADFVTGVPAGGLAIGVFGIIAVIIAADYILLKKQRVTA